MIYKKVINIVYFYFHIYRIIFSLAQPIVGRGSRVISEDPTIKKKKNKYFGFLLIILYFSIILKFQHIVIFNEAKTVASGKSKGARLVSAKQQINHIIIKGNKGIPNQMFF